jgi:hypothetical protein
MYLQNKYTRWYNNIIANAQLRVLPSTTYSEKHHIVPKSLGGNNSKLNLVKLTAKEHYICHLLLPKMTEHAAKRSMCHALWKIVNQHRDYQHRYKVTARMYENIKQKNAIALSISNTGKPNLAARGKTIDDAYRDKIRQTLLEGNYKGIKKPTKQCIHCGKIFAGHIINRFHNKNCKSLLPEIPKKSKVAWNKGLSKTTDARIAKLSKKVSIAMTGVKRGPYKTHK